MIDARNKFREGFVMIQRPFSFGNLKNPVQKFTVVWAYSEKPIIRKELTETAQEEVDLIFNSSRPLGYFTAEEKEAAMQREIDKVWSNQKNWNEIYKGDIVQTYIDGELVRLYPEEYKIINQEKLTELMAEEGYHAVCSKGIYRMKDFRDKQHYLMSRGVSRHIATKWASMESSKILLCFRKRTRRYQETL